MNLVAHQILSFNEEEIQIGNWLGETVKGKKFNDYSKNISKGILLHRQIDTFTDSNNLVKEATAIFHPNQRKYAPIVVDIVFDYYLIKHWNKYRNDTFIDFKNNVYTLLTNHLNTFPPKLKEFTQAMIKYDWFQKYSTLDGIGETLTALSQRSKFPNDMKNAIKDIYLNDKEIEDIFLEFFPLLESNSKSFLNTEK